MQVGDRAPVLVVANVSPVVSATESTGVAKNLFAAVIVQLVVENSHFMATKSYHCRKAGIAAETASNRRLS